MNSRATVTTHPGVDYDNGRNHAKNSIAGRQLETSVAEPRVRIDDDAGWEADFLTDPLKNVDITHLAKERTVKEQVKLKKLLWDIRGDLSNGTLDFTGPLPVPHNTKCRIETTIDTPTS